MGDIRIKRALLSVSDKTGIIELEAVYELMTIAYENGQQEA